MYLAVLLLGVWKQWCTVEKTTECQKCSTIYKYIYIYVYICIYVYIYNSLYDLIIKFLSFSVKENCLDFLNNYSSVGITYKMENKQGNKTIKTMFIKTFEIPNYKFLYIAEGYTISNIKKN
jgi:hypothetical protein